MLRKKLENLETVLPHLQSIAGRKKDTNIVYFDGQKGYAASAANTIELLKGKDLSAFYAYSPDVRFMSKEYTRLLYEKYVILGEAGTKIRGITPNDMKSHETLEPLIHKYGWEFRYLPLEKYASLVSFIIVDDYIIMNSRQKEQNIIIKNGHAADAQRQIFDMIWASCEHK